jgi:trigger factor
MESTVEQLDDHRVRLRIAVTAQEFDKAIDAAFRKIAREVRIPGFRPGKAPRRLLEARLGTEAAREEALRDALPEYYANAVIEHDVDVIAAPEIEITGGEDSGDVEFEAIVEVRPEVEIEGYRGLRVEVPWEPVSDDDVERQVDRLREQFGDLEESEDPLIDGAYATIDLTGRQDGDEVEGLVATDFLYEVGSEIVVTELDEQLRGKRPGDILAFDATLPPRFGDRAGETVEFTAVVKEVKRKVLPELTDEWVSEASEFETVDELRADVRRRIEIVRTAQVRMLLRERVVEAAGALVDLEPPESLVGQEMQSRLHELGHRLQAQGATFDDFLEASGRTQEDLLAELREGAERAVRADLALRAVVAQEELRVTDEELESEVERMATRAGRKPDQVWKALRREGTIEAVRSDLVRRKALEFLVEHAEVVDGNGEPVDLGAAAESTEAPDVESDYESIAMAGDDTAGDDVAGEAAEDETEEPES